MANLFDDALIPTDFPLHSIVQGTLDTAEEATRTSKAKGFEWSEETIPTALMLTVTEVSEAMGEWRNMKAGDPLPQAFYEELADIILRIGSLVGYLPGGTLKLAHAVALKALANRGRPYRHGGKRA